MTDPTATYTFLPWLRQGIASKIKQVDTLNESVAHSPDRKRVATIQPRSTQGYREGLLDVAVLYYTIDGLVANRATCPMRSPEHIDDRNYKDAREDGEDKN